MNTLTADIVGGLTGDDSPVEVSSDWKIQARFGNDASVLTGDTAVARRRD